MKQTDLESEMLALGVSRYRSRMSKCRSSKLETCSPAGQRVLERAVQEMTKAFTEWLASGEGRPGRRHRCAPLMESMPIPVVAMITCRCIIDGIASIRTINSLAAMIGRHLEDEYRFRTVRKAEPRWWAKMMKLVSSQPGDLTRRRFLKKSAKLHGLSLPSWSVRDRVAFGLVCVELMRQHTGVIEIENRTDIRGKDMTIVQIGRAHV